MTDHRPLTRVEAGLPAESIVVRVIHCRASRRTFLELRLSGGPARHRIYSRAAGTDRYEQVGEPTAEQSYEDLVADAQGRIFFRVVEWRPFAGSVGGHTLGVWSVDAGALPTARPLTLDGIVPEKAWVARLLSVDDAGTHLTAVVALRNGHVKYAIHLLDLERSCAEELDVLGGVYF